MAAKRMPTFCKIYRQETGWLFQTLRSLSLAKRLTDATRARVEVEGIRVKLQKELELTQRLEDHARKALKGVTQKLDHIKGLGTTAIWLTPSFKNNPVQGAGDNVSAGYHGYWITDFTQIDPHLGTNADMKNLIAKAHAKGMKVFFDIITNHTADIIDYTNPGTGTDAYKYIDKETSPYKTAAGEKFDDRDYAGKNTFPELDAATSFPYTPTFRSEADKTVKVHRSNIMKKLDIHKVADLVKYAVKNGLVEP